MIKYRFCAIALLTFAGWTCVMMPAGIACAQETEAPVPTLDEVEIPTDRIPAAPEGNAISAQPSRLVYIGSEGGFLLHRGKSRGIFRWGSHWANSISYYSEDSNFYYYQLVETNGWFAFSKNANGGRYVIWKGIGTASNVTWQNQPNGWMRATRATAAGNLD